MTDINSCHPSSVFTMKHFDNNEWLHKLLRVSQMQQDPEAGFNLETLQICILDLIEAGTETASTTLRWALTLILNYPSVQGRCLISSRLL